MGDQDSDISQLHRCTGPRYSTRNMALDFLHTDETICLWSTFIVLINMWTRKYWRYQIECLNICTFMSIKIYSYRSWYVVLLFVASAVLSPQPHQAFWSTGPFSEDCNTPEVGNAAEPPSLVWCCQKENLEFKCPELFCELVCLFF